MSRNKKWIQTCKLLAFYATDPISAEMALVIVEKLNLKKKMAILSAVYLASQWGSQCGRSDHVEKQNLARYFGFDSSPHSEDMKTFGDFQMRIFSKLDFNVRKFGKVSGEFAGGQTSKQIKFFKNCLALHFFEPQTTPEQRAQWAQTNKILEYSQHLNYKEVLTLSGKLIGCYIKRSKLEEEFCKNNLKKRLGF